MHIQWYPGHMTKARRTIEQMSGLCDAVLYVLDARAAGACLNPDFDRILGKKPTLFLLNKSDLADPAVTAEWISFFRAQGREARAVVGGDLASKKVIAEGLKSLLKERLARDAAKGVRRPIRAMIVGIPNCGKSTLLNSAAGQKRALTGDRPGVTRGTQWIRLAEGLELLDTPGTLWNAFSDQTVGLHLAFLGSINDDILDFEELAGELLKTLSELAPAAAQARCKVALSGDPARDLPAVAAARGFLGKGGTLDLERCARALVDDFRKGRMGRISLERPPRQGQPEARNP